MRASSTAGLPPLLPEPRSVRRLPGALRLRDGLPIVLEAGSDDADFASACVLRDALERRAGVRLPVETHGRRRDLGPCIALTRRGAEGEGHRIHVGENGAELAAEGPAGLRWAVETLAQLVDRRGSLASCRIEDAPDFPRRGIMLDVSRGKVPTLDCLRELVDRCASLKLNVLMLYVEHTFRFRRHPEIGAGCSPLEAETLRELDDYAARNHVELIPCLQSLGHMEHVLRLPRYAELAESARRWSLAPSHPGTYTLLEELYQEFLPNFRSPLFHANCDEPFDLGQGRSAARAAAIGPGALFREHVERVRELAGALGKRTLVWADFVHQHPDQISKLPDDLVLLDWGYEADHDFERAAAFSSRGLEFWVCPGTSTWNALFPRLRNALDNIAGWADAGRRHGARGLLLTDWGDFGHYNLLGNSWLPYAWAAQQAWSGDVPARRFDRACARVLFRDESAETLRAIRALDRHDAGFRIPNASPIQLLYFDDLDAAFFLRGARPGAVRRSLASLEKARTRLVATGPRFRADPLTHAELVHAAEASILALRKALVARDYVAWRERPGVLDARDRRRMARVMHGLAEEQRAQGRRLRGLWLSRSRPSNFELTRRRLDRSIRSLRRAARALERGRAPAPPPAHEGFAPRRVLAELRESVGLA